MNAQQNEMSIRSNRIFREISGADFILETNYQ